MERERGGEGKREGGREGGREGDGGRWRERGSGRERKWNLFLLCPVPFSFPDLPLSLSLEGKRERGCDRQTDGQEREEEKESGMDGPMDRQASGRQRR